MASSRSFAVTPNSCRLPVGRLKALPDLYLIGNGQPANSICASGL
jgi:hypothetical protein